MILQNNMEAAEWWEKTENYEYRYFIEQCSELVHQAITVSFSVVTAPSLLYSGYRVFPGGKADGAWRWPSTPSSTEVNERVELYLYSPSGPSWFVLRQTLPLPMHSLLILCTLLAILLLLLLLLLINYLTLICFLESCLTGYSEITLKSVDYEHGELVVDRCDSC